MLNWVNSNSGRSVTSALVAVALAVKTIAPGHTIAAHVADYVLQFGVLFGVYSSSSKVQPK